MNAWFQSMRKAVSHHKTRMNILAVRRCLPGCIALQRRYPGPVSAPAIKEQKCRQLPCSRTAQMGQVDLNRFKRYLCSCRSL